MLEMGFDKHFYEDHCYLDDPADGVAMNVEIIEENYQSPQSNEQSIIYLDQSASSSSYSNMNVSSEDINKTNSKKALVFLPYSEYCTDHKDLYLHEDEKLVKPGDKFLSLEDFVQYLNENAKRWCFYYKCSDSRKPNTEYESFTYNCVYLRNKEKYKKKGLRKRNNNMKTNCPCKIKLRHLPNEKELTVVYVCNHHDHELSVEEFYKLQHGRRLPPHVKEEIMDLLKLKVDVMKIRAYVAMETGFNMSRPFFYALEKNMKSRNIDRQITEDRLMMLREKIAAAENTEPSRKTKHMRSLDDTEETRRTPPLKKRSKTTNVASSENSKRLKILECSSNSYNSETLQSVKHLQESVKCEIQRNPWVLDQCVPVLPNRTAIQSNCEEAVHSQIKVEESREDAHPDAQNGLETFSYTIDYYDSDDNNTHEIVSNELSEIIDDGQVDESEENYIDNIAYETVVTDDNHEEQSEVIEYVNEDQLVEENVEIHLDTQEHEDDENGTINDDLENTHDVEEIENHIDYVTEDNDDEVEYIHEVNEENAAHDVGVQTADNMKAAQMLMPVFDVYMKDGNVTGFVVNDNMISGLKDGVDKGIQTSEDLTFSDTQDLEDEDLDCDIIHDEVSDTYTKHEYVHRYNIDKYMVQPHFPKYVETLAKETYMDVLHMFTNIYNEKAMFKITTTQKGKEGNTRIWYVADGSKRQRKNGKNKEKLKKRLQSAFVLKDRVRTLVKHNSELVTRNKQLEEVALKLVDMA